MRELKDYFCTETQSEKLKELGFNEKCIGYWYTENESNRKIDYQVCDLIFLGDEPDYVLAPLRSQALDFFRDKGWQFAIKCLNKMYWYEIYIGDSISFDENITEDGLYDYHVSESALIDKLIELIETEA